MSIYIVPQSGPIQSVRDPNRSIESHQVIKQIGVEFLQIMYSQEGVPTRLQWDPDLSQSEIQIADKYTFNQDDVNTRPAIVAGRGPMRWKNASGFQQMQVHDFRTAQTISTDLIQGVVVFNCFSEEGLEAEAIAGDVFDWFRMYRKPLRQSGLFRVESTAMGEEALVKSDSRPDMSVVPVQVEAYVQIRWSIQPYAPLLRRIVATIGEVRTIVGSFNP